jgi:hypothetical protein
MKTEPYPLVDVKRDLTMLDIVKFLVTLLSLEKAILDI